MKEKTLVYLISDTTNMVGEVQSLSGTFAHVFWDDGTSNYYLSCELVAVSNYADAGGK